MGENIETVLFDRDVSLPNEQYFDFLLFDDSTALVHDYGTDGRQVGGWLVTEPEILRDLEATVVGLRRGSQSLSAFLGN
jgi:hypothetical protein